MTNYQRYPIHWVKFIKINLYLLILAWIFLVGFNPLNAKPAPNSFSDLVEKYLLEEKLIISKQSNQILSDGPFKK